MTRILIPTDFSENAFRALRYAVYLFEREKCEFILLNAYHTDASRVASMRSQKRDTRLFRVIRESAERDLARLLEKIKAEKFSENHSFRAIAKADVLLNAVGETVLENRVDYIFMGTQGATGLKSVFMGSNAVKVITKITFCPVVAVPSDYDFDIPSQILFATGFEHVYDKYELNPLINLAKLWDSKILVLHVAVEEELKSHQKTAQRVVKERLKHVNHDTLYASKDKSINKTIQKVIEENEEIGMVAMIDYWHSFKERLTHEAVIKKVGFQTTVPFLVMHLPD